MNNKKYFIESYGCAMNFADSELVASILNKNNYLLTEKEENADLILLNTCSIREKAEQSIRNRLLTFKKQKIKNKSLIIGILGCMAERLKTTLLEEEKLVDLVAGPDSYRDLPNLIENCGKGEKSINVLLSRDETYADISPVKLDNNGVTSFVSITRGCDNMCSFCVVPFTRGRERSRNPLTIVSECKELFDQGYREITLLGQNVDSYRWNINSKGEIIDKDQFTTNFSQLLEMVALVNPNLRVRFSTSHPKDMTDEVIYMIKKYENICNYVHLPVQSGSDAVLNRMNRKYNSKWYLDRISKIKEIIPDIAISSDIIVGFCGETNEDHNDTLEIMKKSQFVFSYMFTYSERPNTLAERKYKDDIDINTKKKRLNEVIELQSKLSAEYTKTFIGTTQKVLIEKLSKKSNLKFSGRNSHNISVVFDKQNNKPGDYVDVKITDCTTTTLLGEIVK